eukprot:m.112548 g.112548  ORF g.112548 m.112548 type:complete len:193 (-) comp14092_c0_seq5:68-646(-)
MLLYNYTPFRDFLSRYYQSTKMNFTFNFSFFVFYFFLLNRVILGEPRLLYPLEDHIGACTVNVYKGGDNHFWHFDESPFSVTLMLQTPEQGGEFEAISSVRTGIREVSPASLLGNIPSTTRLTEKDDPAPPGTQTLPFDVGTLSVFAGRETLHRVKKVVGTRRRLVAVMCFSDKPGVRNSEETRLRFWGRAK